MYDYKYERLNRERLMLYRRKKTKKVINDLGLDALVLTDASNVRFASDVRGYGSPELHQCLNIIIINEEGDQILLTQAFKEFPKIQYPWIKHSFDLPAWRPITMQVDVFANLVRLGLTQLGVKSGKIGVDYLPFQVIRHMEIEMREYKMSSCCKEMLEERMIKSDDEIELLRIVSSWNDAGMYAARQACTIGNTEFDVVSACIAGLGKSGAEGLSHYPGVRSGERTLYDYKPVGRTLRGGDSVIIDCGLYGEGGYASDFCRTYFVGEPSPELARCYEIVKESILQGVDSMKPGVTSTMVNRIVNAVLTENGYPQSIYSNGHGIGMGLVELPTIASEEEVGENIILQENMVICLEPITFCKGGGVKLEDVILVTKDGGERLTKTPYL